MTYWNIKSGFISLRNSRKRKLPELEAKFKNKVCLGYSQSAKSWMNDPLTVEYLGNVIKKDMFGRKKLLIWDSFRHFEFVKSNIWYPKYFHQRCHLTPPVKAQLQKLQIEMSVIPAGCTSILQPADTHWNAVFKRAYRGLYDKWNSDESLHEYTKWIEIFEIHQKFEHFTALAIENPRDTKKFWLGL